MFSSQYSWSQTILFQVRTVPLLPVHVVLHTSHWVKARSRKTAAALWNSPVDLGGLGLGDIGLVSRSWFRCLFSPHASQSQENKLWIPILWRWSSRWVWGHMLNGEGMQKKGQEEGKEMGWKKEDWKLHLQYRKDRFGWTVQLKLS